MAAGVSAFYILDIKGKILISRNYRDDLPRNVMRIFTKRVLKEQEESIRPFFEDEGFTFCHIKYNNLYLVIVTKSNSNAMMLVLYLYHVVEVFKAYFKELEEESIKDNFVVVYELLDEMMDYGYPQTTDYKVLQDFIKVEANPLQNIMEKSFSEALAAISKMTLKNAKNLFGISQTEDTSKKLYVPKAITGIVNRPGGIKYKKNEVFLDVIESINLLVSSNGTLLRSEICGVLNMRVYLSGFPTLKLGLNDKILFDNLASSGSGRKRRAVDLEDVAFHQCVSLNKFTTDRTITFEPPDGEFDLMTYRLNTRVKPLIWAEQHIEKHSDTRIEYTIKAKAQFKRRSVASNVEIYIPVPKDSSIPTYKSAIGVVRYAPECDCMVWQIKQFQGGKQYVMKAQITLPTVQEQEEKNAPRRPISIKFEIPYYTVSGLQVRYLKIMEKSNYQALPWVRYITKAGDYQLRQ